MNIVITAGGTSEYIDKVRKITNSGSGKLGSIIANTLLKRTDIQKIFYICSEKAILPWDDDRIEIIRIKGTIDLKNAVKNVLSQNHIHWFIHSMAVSDYYVDAVTTAERIAKETSTTSDIASVLKNPKNRIDNSDKISSYEDNLILVLKQTPKIIGMIHNLSPDTHLIGFKLLENVTVPHLIEVASNLRDKNHCEYVLANDLANIGHGYHEAYLLDKQGHYNTLHTKEQIAAAITDVIYKDEYAN